MDEYKKQATDFLEKHGITFSAQHIGPDCPKFCKDREHRGELGKFPRKTHIHGAHYVVTFKRTGVRSDGLLARNHGKAFDVDFWNSYADEEWNALGQARYRFGESLYKHGLKGKRGVHPYDVLACLTKTDPGTFDDFCDEVGLHADSRKAEQTYFAVQKEYQKVQKFFTEAEIGELQEIR